MERREEKKNAQCSPLLSDSLLLPHKAIQYKSYTTQKTWPPQNGTGMFLKAPRSAPHVSMNPTTPKVPGERLDTALCAKSQRPLAALSALCFSRVVAMCMFFFSFFFSLNKGILFDRLCEGNVPLLMCFSSLLSLPPTPLPLPNIHERRGLRGQCLIDCFPGITFQTINTIKNPLKPLKPQQPASIYPL